MPAAAVIPAPIAYINVVAVKKLVVGFWVGVRGPPKGEHCGRQPYLTKAACALHWVCVGFVTFTVKKLECSKQAIA